MAYTRDGCMDDSLLNIVRKENPEPGPNSTTTGFVNRLLFAISEIAAIESNPLSLFIIRCANHDRQLFELDGDLNSVASAAPIVIFFNTYLYDDISLLTKFTSWKDTQMYEIKGVEAVSINEINYEVMNR